MGLKETVHSLKKMLAELERDLEKADRGNKTAAQRVRTGTLRFAKCAKTYRQESVAAEKKGSSKSSAKRRTSR